MNWDDDDWEPTPFLSANQKSKWEDEDQDLKATKVISPLSILELDNLLGVITVRRNDLLTANKKPKTRKMSKKHYKDGKDSVPLVGGYWLVLGQKRIRNLYTGPLQILEEYFVIEAKIL